MISPSFSTSFSSQVQTFCFNPCVAQSQQGIIYYSFQLQHPLNVLYTENYAHKMSIFLHCINLIFMDSIVMMQEGKKSVLYMFNILTIFFTSFYEYT